MATHWNVPPASLIQELPIQEEGLGPLPQPHQQDLPPNFGQSDSQLSKSISFPVQKSDPFSRLYNTKNSITNERLTRLSTSQDESKISRSAQRNSASQGRETRGTSVNGLSNSNSRSNLSKRGTPARPLSAMPGDVSGSRSPTRMSDKAVLRIAQAKIAFCNGQKIGAEGFDALVHRKTLEKQVEILENRLNKLKAEENLMSKKIKETTQKTDKILTSKKRRQDELQMKDIRNKRREEDLARKRLELLKEREENKNSLKKSKLYNFKNKHDVAYTMKVDNAYHKALKEEFQKRRDDRNKDLITKVQGGNNTSLTMRQTRDSFKKEEVNNKYSEKIGKDKEKAELLAVKCKELERQEHQMLEKLSQTYNLHKEKIVELEKAFTMKVNVTDE